MFLINWGDITGRIDPSSFRKFRVFQSDKFPIIQMGEVVEINPSVSFLDKDKDTDISFIPMERIDENLGELKQIATKKIGDSAGFTRFEEGDLLWAKITPCMQNGKSAVANNLVNAMGCGSTEFFVIRPKNSTILIEYIHFILRDERVLQFAQNYFGGAAGQQRVSKDFLLYLPIPIPDVSTQQRIVSIMNKAYEQKKKKAKESEDLLKSINDYILNVLGVCLSNKETYGLSDRIFYIKSSDVLGQRLDPTFYFKDSDFEQCLIQSEYSIVDFNDIITSVSNGVEIRNYQTSGYRYLRVSDMSSNEIVDDNIRFVEADGIPTKIRLSLNDIIISRSGSLGLVNVVTDEILDAILSSHIFKVSIMPNINVNYLQEYLRSTLGQIQFFRNNNGGIIPEINQNALKKIKIVLPSKEIQDEIAQFSINTRNKANELLDEADKIISNAKQEVENILMGDKQ